MECNMECNFYANIKDENGKPKICHIENICYGYDDLHNEISKYAWSGKSIYIACIVADTSKTEFYFYDDGNCMLIDRISIDVLSFAELEKFAQSGKYFDGVAWQDKIPEENKSEIKADPDIFKDWKDVNYIIWLHQFLAFNFKIRKQFNSVSAIREAEEHNHIESCESIMLYTKDAAYIISYDVSCIIEIIYIIYDQEVLEVLERDNTKSPIVFDLCSAYCCKANKYMAKPDVAATMKDILYNIIPDIIPDTVTVHELEYNRFSYESELKMGLWKDVNISVELNLNKNERKKLVITKAFLNPEDLMRAEFKSYVDNDDYVLVLGDPDKAYIQCTVEGSESIYIIAKEGLHREIYETDFDRYNLIYTFDIIGSTDIENPTDFVFDTPEMSEMIMVKYTLYITNYISTNKIDKVASLIDSIVQPKSDYSIKDIESVKFDPPYTFVVWKDNTVAFYKANCNELFDKRKGLAICIAQKALGDDFEDVLKKFINEDPEEEDD